MKLLVFCAFAFGFGFGWLIAKWNAIQESIRKCENCAWFAKEIDHTVTATISELDDAKTNTPLTTGMVDMDGLILTESGGNALAVGDGGRSLGLCQIGRAAWYDVDDWEKKQGCVTTLQGDYDRLWQNPVVNRATANYYINNVIPQKYFRVWGIPDTVEARIAAYKYGPGKFRYIWRAWGNEWPQHVGKTVQRDLEKYHQFVQQKNESFSSPSSGKGL